MERLWQLVVSIFSVL